MEFYISPQSGQFYMINVLENQWLSVTHRLSLISYYALHEKHPTAIMPGLHLQRNRRNSAIQKIYDGRGNFYDGCVASGARLLRRLRCSTLTTGPS